MKEVQLGWREMSETKVCTPVDTILVKQRRICAVGYVHWPLYNPLGLTFGPDSLQEYGWERLVTGNFQRCSRIG